MAQKLKKWHDKTIFFETKCLKIKSNCFFRKKKLDISNEKLVKMEQ